MNFVSILLAFCFAPTFVYAHSVKTDHLDVHLWSEAGRQNSKVGVVKRFEEVQVLESKNLTNGEQWLKVELRRHPGWRVRSVKGWVDAKFFRSIELPNREMRSMEASSIASCAACRSKVSNLKQKTDSLSSIAKYIQSSKGPRSGQTSFIWPVGGVIRSAFGMRRHPITGFVRLHSGTDIAGNNGNPVVAAKSGTIVSSRGGCRTGVKSCNGGAGNFVVIDHGDGTQSKYLHLSGACPVPSAQTRVEQGQKIACVGSTGASTGPHLHFGVVMNGRYVDPLAYLPNRIPPAASSKILVAKLH